MRPKNIIYFENLILASLFLGGVQSYLQWPMLIQKASIGFVLFIQLSVFAVFLTLTLLVSRRGSRIAMWISIALFVLGLPVYFSQISGGSIKPNFISMTQLVLQFAAFSLLLSPSVRDWMRSKMAN